MEKQTRKERTTNRLGNKGSTFIVVIVAVSFLSVLGTIIIAISTANLQMKQVEYAAKKNLYTDEKILDDIYHGIGKVSAEYLSKAYTDVLAEVSSDSGEARYRDQETAFNAFSDKFINKLKAQYGDEGDFPDSTDNKARTLMKSYITVEDQAVLHGNAPSIEVASVDRIDIEEDRGVPYQYAFRDVVVKYRVTNPAGEETGYEATITTDIVIEVPYLNFFQDSTRALDYAMIANEGIYFSGASNRKIVGNVYGGISKEEKDGDLQNYRGVSTAGKSAVGVYGGLNFYNATVSFDSNYLITKGDINVRNSNVTIGNTASKADTQVWAETIRTVEKENRLAGKEPSTLNIAGNIYVANDLELNARESNVTLEGAYYGYNGGRYETWEKKGLLGGQYADGKHMESSAIIINGNESTLDLSRLNTLVVSGVAYVDILSKPYSDSYYEWLPAGKKIEEYATGESLALKANQYIYLAPSYCLTTTNPVKESEIPPDIDFSDINDINNKVWSEVGARDWFGTGYVKSDYPIEAKYVWNRTQNVGYWYFYLNFDNEATKMEYAGMILNMKDPTSGSIDTALEEKYNYARFDAAQLAEIWNIKDSLQRRVGASAVQINASAMIYTKGAMTKVSGTWPDTEVDSPLVPERYQLSDEYIGKLESELYKHYIWWYKELDPKEGIALTDEPGTIFPEDYDKLPNNPNNNNYPNDQYPAEKFVSFGDLPSAPGSRNSPYRDSSYENIISFSDSVTVESSFNGIILCRGDVIIQDTVSVKGLIIAGGKIYIKGNGSIEANRSVVQSILDEEMREESKRESGNPRTDYAITYLKDINVNYMGTDNTHRISGTDYTEFMSYENWRKGDID